MHRGYRRRHRPGRWVDRVWQRGTHHLPWPLVRWFAQRSASC